MANKLFFKLGYWKRELHNNGGMKADLGGYKGNENYILFAKSPPVFYRDGCNTLFKITKQIPIATLLVPTLTGDTSKCNNEHTDCKFIFPAVNIQVII